MIRKFSMIALLTLTGWINTSNAALVGACTFPAGCAPDFNIVEFDVDYTYNAGTDTGILSINNGTAGNSSFNEGQLDSTWENTVDHQGNAYGRTSLQVIEGSGTGNDNFNFTITVDGSGNIIAGTNNATLNGRVVAFNLDLLGPTGSPYSTAISHNGSALDGTLITGATIDQLGWSGTTIDFLGNIDDTSLLTAAGFGNGFGGVLTLGSQFSLSSVKWDENWTSDGTLDVVVPIPAGIWLFLSGLTALFTFGKRKIA